jgi:hypothetical protein
LRRFGGVPQEGLFDNARALVDHHDAVERQHLVVQHRDGRLGLLGDVQEAEGIAPVSVEILAKI